MSGEKKSRFTTVNNLKRMPPKAKKIGKIIAAIPIIFIGYIVYGAMTSKPTAIVPEQQGQSSLTNLGVEGRAVDTVSSDYIRLQKENDKAKANEVLNNGQTGGAFIATPDVKKVANTAFTKEEFLDGVNVSTEVEEPHKADIDASEPLSPLMTETNPDTQQEENPETQQSSPLFAKKPDAPHYPSEGAQPIQVRQLSSEKRQEQYEDEKKAYESRVGKIVAFTQVVADDWTKSRIAGTWQKAYTKPKDSNADTPRDNGAYPNKGATVDIGDNRDRIGYKALMPGDRLLARVDANVNSDHPSKIIFVVTTGALEGANILGNFSAQGENPIIVIETITWKGKTAAMKGVATDPFKNQNFVEGDVDSHTLSRWTALAASYLIKGYSEAIMNSGSTTTSNGTSTTTARPMYTQNELLIQSGGALAGKGADIASQYFGTPPTITIDQGEVFGILITEPMILDWLPLIVKGRDVL